VVGEGLPWIEVDQDGAWLEGSTAGILKPAVVMFGESIAEETKTAAESTIDDAGRLLVVGSSLATYSAWRLARRAKQRGIPVAILNLGGVRGEEELMTSSAAATTMPVQHADGGVRIDLKADELLPEVVRHLRS
jgi:NAD-dependent SIR2 family protein deacetylase